MFLKDINTTGQKLEMACDQPDLKIKCRHDNNSCDRSRKKKYHRRKFKFHNKRFSESFPQRKRFFKQKFTKKEKIQMFHMWPFCKKIVHIKRMEKSCIKFMQQQKLKKQQILSQYIRRKMNSPLSAISNVMTLFFHQCFKKNQKDDQYFIFKKMQNIKC